MAVGVAACAPAAAPGWTYGPALASGQPAPSAGTASAPPSIDHSPAPSASTAPVDHDTNAKAVVDRFLDGEASSLPQGNQPLEPTLDGDTKVFELTIDKIRHQIDVPSRHRRPVATDWGWTARLDRAIRPIRTPIQ